MSAQVNDADKDNSSTGKNENGKGAKSLLASRRWSSSESSVDSANSEQAGVKGITAIARVWTTWSLITAYAGCVVLSSSVICLFMLLLDPPQPRPD